MVGLLGIWSLLQAYYIGVAVNDVFYNLPGHHSAVLRHPVSPSPVICVICQHGDGFCRCLLLLVDGTEECHRLVGGYQSDDGYGQQPLAHQCAQHQCGERTYQRYGEDIAQQWSVGPVDRVQPASISGDEQRQHGHYGKSQQCLMYYLLHFFCSKSLFFSSSVREE